MSEFIFLLGIISIFSTCKKPFNEPDYNFSVTESFFPERDSISVGDSLLINCIIPKIETDSTSGKLISFSNLANLGGNLVISDISKFNMQRERGR